MKKFKDVTKDILTNEQFLKLKNEMHHGTTRYDHSVRVGKIMFYATRNSNYTRAALMHDFFFGDSTAEHPYKAIENAKRITELNDLQENMIASHMFPITKTPVLYFGGWILVIIDKLVATYEIGRNSKNAVKMTKEVKGYFKKDKE
jgi:uncharacterized protein